MSIIKYKQEGDTIIEVMIVLAVLGLALGIAYATANRSLINSRQAQENSAATELAQSQIESLRTMTGDTGTNNIFQAGPFCVSSFPYNVEPETICTNYNKTIYTIAIKYFNTSNPYFSVLVSWSDVGGGQYSATGMDTVNLVYRLYSS